MITLGLLSEPVILGLFYSLLCLLYYSYIPLVYYITFHLILLFIIFFY